MGNLNHAKINKRKAAQQSRQKAFEKRRYKPLKPTQKQIEFLRKHRIQVNEKTLTRSTASKLIGDFINSCDAPTINIAKRDMFSGTTSPADQDDL